MTDTPDSRIIPGMDPTPTDDERRRGLCLSRSKDDTPAIVTALAASRVATARAMMEWAGEWVDAHPYVSAWIGLNHVLAAHDAAVAERKNEGRDVQ